MLYRVEKDGIGFYINQDLVEDYAKLGYKIYRVEYVPIEDIQEEKDFIQKTSNISSIEVDR